MAVVVDRGLSVRGGRKPSALNYQLSTSSPSLGRAYRGGDAFPFRRQAGKIVSQSAEIAIDCSRAAAWLVSRRIFQRRG